MRALRSRRSSPASLFCVPLHYLWKLFGARSPWPQLFLGYAGAALRPAGPRRGHAAHRQRPLSPPTMSAGSTSSRIGGATPRRLRRRATMSRTGRRSAGWPALNDTIYVARQARREVHGQADPLRHALAAGRAVALFPEGTTEGGHEVLPFRAEPVRLALPAARRASWCSRSRSIMATRAERDRLGRRRRPMAPTPGACSSRPRHAPGDAPLPRPDRPGRGRRPQERSPRRSQAAVAAALGASAPAARSPIGAAMKTRESPDLPRQVASAAR